MSRLSHSKSPIRRVPNRSPENPPFIASDQNVNFNVVKYIISAEFDNKVGSVIKHQIPNKLPGFKEHLSTTLPELMIPLNSEKSQSEDYNVFILYCDQAGKYRLLPDVNKEIIEDDGLGGLQHMKVNQINTIYEGNDEEEESGTHFDDILFFLNVTKKIDDKSNDRGAVIKSIAIGTPLRNFIIFKHLITLAIQVYIQDSKLQHLIKLFNVINSTDVSIWSQYSRINSNLYNILSLNYKFKNRILLSHFKDIVTKDMCSHSVAYKNGTLQYHSSYKESLEEKNDMTIKMFKTLPLNFSLNHPSTSIQTDLNVNASILKFLLKLSEQLNSIDYKNLRIIIYSDHSKLSNDYLCQFILSLSNFFNGFNQIYFHNDKVLYFPLLDLYNFEEVKKFDKEYQNMKIIGTNNIILKDFEDFYDFFYDLTDDILTKSPELITYDVSINKTFEFMEILTNLLESKQDQLTIKLSLQRFNIWQIIKILNREDTGSIRDAKNNDDEESELNLKDYYLSRNKNLVMFEEFFEFQTIRLIDSLNKFLEITKKLNNDDFNDSMINDLHRFYDFSISYVSSVTTKHISNFIYLLEIFPFIEQSTIAKLIYDVEVDLLEKSALNDLFKPIFIKDSKLQSKIVRLYELLMHSSLRIVIEQRLNPFLVIALNELIEDSKPSVKTGGG